MPRTGKTHQRVWEGEDVEQVSRKNNRPLNMVNLPEFNVGTEDWYVYEELLEQFFAVNAVEEERKVSVLITSMGMEAYKYLRDLCVPDLPKNKSYEDLCDIMRCQFSRKVSVFRERVQFYTLKQNKEESIKDWYVNIKKQASNCNFGNRLEGVLKDKFVCGLEEGPIKDRLCEEDPDAKTLKQFFELALTRELSKLPHGSSFEESNEPRPVYSNKQRLQSQIRQKQSTNKLCCDVCGSKFHERSACKYKTFRCRLCKEIGHLQRVCSKKRIQSIEDNQATESDDDQHTNHRLQSVEVLHVSNNSFVKPIIVEVMADEQRLFMEVDTGSSISLISKGSYEKLFKGVKGLNPTQTRLKSFSGEVIRPLGTLYVEVKWRNKVQVCTLYVVDKASQNLMGRDWLSLFNWPGLYEVNNVSNSEKDLEKLFSDYSDLFKDEIGCYKYSKVELKLKESSCPRFIKPRPIPFAFRQQVDDELDRMERSGIIERVDASVWGTPLVPVLKSSGKIRVCANYKLTVNPHLEDVNHPLPKIEDIWAALEGGQAFTKLDFCQAYNQLELEENTKMILAWSTHRGVFKMNRLPFGTKPAVSIFQREVEKTLQGLKGFISFLDDIVVTGRSYQEHLENLENVFNKLSHAGFRLNLEKCEFFKPEVRYLGHIINKDGIKKDPEKIRAALQCPRPSNVTELRSFIGLVSYFGKFIKNLSSILHPLYLLLKKGVKFIWDNSCENAFKEAKQAISSDQVLTYYNPSLPLCLYCDASNNGISAVLLHEMTDGHKRPIGYASRILSSAERNYSTIHKEALALYWGMKKFDQYLMGKRFILYSDHKPLEAIFGDKRGIPEMAAGRLQRWSTYLSGFDYEFRHISSCRNLADEFSRMPVGYSRGNRSEVEPDLDYVNLVSEVLPISIEQVRSETRNDPVLSKVITYVKSNWPKNVDPLLKAFLVRRSELSVDNDVLMWGYRLVVPKKYQAQLLNEIHTAHQGMIKMKNRARSYFWWPGLDSDIESYCKKCHICMSTRQQPATSEGSWKPAEAPFDRVHIDYAGPIKGKYYLVLTDAFSKWPEVCEVTSVTTDTTLKKLREIFARFGVPKVLVSDNAAQFTSKEFKDFCKFNIINHVTTPPFHPSSNGAAENSVKTFKRCLMKHLMETAKKVPVSTAISRYLFSYRISVHCSTGETPAKRMFGRELRNRLDILRDDVQLEHSGNKDVQSKFKLAEEVYVRDYRNIKKSARWVKATVEKVLSHHVYLVRPKGEQQLWKRHVDQIIKIVGT